MGGVWDYGRVEYQTLKASTFGAKTLTPAQQKQLIEIIKTFNK